MNHWYVGHNAGRIELFAADAIPTETSHGMTYAAVIGPFRTKRGATFMALHGRSNPHCRCVADAERLARKYARESV